MAANKRVKLPMRNQQVEDLLLWRDTYKSGVALGASVAVFAVLQFVRINVVSTAALAGAALVFGLLLWNVAAGVLKRPPAPVPRLLLEGVSETEMRALADRLTPALNRGLALGGRLATGREPALSAAVAGALYALHRVAARLSLLGLAFAALLAAFSLPKVYETRKEAIDASVEAAHRRAAGLYAAHVERFVAMIPRAQAARPAESSSAVKKDE